MFSSGEYTNAYASPSTEYTNLQNYYKGSQFGPKLPASVPSNGYPTILKQGNEFGYEALTHDTDGNSYYNVEKAYGNSCQPKYYVAKCPENKFLRPFVPDGNSVVGPPTPCPVKTEGIAEGYMYELPYKVSASTAAMGGYPPMPTPTAMPTSMPIPTAVPTSMPFPTAMPTHMPTMMPTPTGVPTASPVAGHLEHLKVLFFYDKNCPHSRQAMDTYQKELGSTPLDTVFLAVKDISQFNNEQLLTELGGTATPFFYSQATNRSVTGFVPGLETLVHGLSGKHHSTESYHPLHDRVKKLNIVVFVMQGCGYCDKIKSMLAQAGVQSLVVFADARDPKYRQELMNVRGFPHYKSMTTGKSSTGYPGSLEKFLSSIE
jgi:glutaredoxin